jgi:hypothetical protein
MKKLCFSRKTKSFEFFVFFDRKEAFTEAKNRFSWSAGLILPNDVKKCEKNFLLEVWIALHLIIKTIHMCLERGETLLSKRNRDRHLVPLLWHHTWIFMTTWLSRKSKSMHVCSMCLSTLDILCCFEKCQNEFLLSQMWFTINDHRTVNQKIFYD